MQTVTDEQLLLLHYGELAEAEAVALRQRMKDDATLAARFAGLCRLLEDIPDDVPEKDAQYGRRTWARVEARLDDVAKKPVRGFLFSSWPLRFATAAVVLAVVGVTAFQLGRESKINELENTQQLVTNTGDASARVLNASLQTHMENTARLFTTVSNTSSGVSVDVESEKQWASTLLIANRLYRFAAEQKGQHRVAALLKDMEPILIQLANSDNTLSDAEFEALRQRIVNQDLLFKTRTSSQTL